MNHALAIGLATLSLIPLAQAGSRPLQPRPITAGVTSQRGAFHAVDSVTITDSRHDPDSPLASYVELDVRGISEGNLCGDDDVGLEQDFIAYGPSLQEVHVYLRQLAVATDRVELERPACPQISHPEDFRARLRLQINGWDESALAKTWLYHFRNESWTLATMAVRFDRATGWTVSLHQTAE